MGKDGARHLVVVSGYYGFNNLGDEAILEEIVNELKQLVHTDDIVVLSDDPQSTEHKFSVRAVDRWSAPALLKLLPAARLFISGGGGLFQDTVSVRSPIFYGMQIEWARVLGVPVLIYAQGIGPLKTRLGQMVSRRAFSRSNQITVRDHDAQTLLSGWGIKSTLTADPVWCLESKPLPQRLEERMNELKGREQLVIGLSLRVSNNFSQADLPEFVTVLENSLPQNVCVVPLVLQTAQDEALLNQFIHLWRHQGRNAELVDTSAIALPSQWASLLGHLDLLIAMRLHAAIMALKSGVPTVADGL